MLRQKWKIGLYLAAILNTLVLMGQLWPEAAPPFALKINIVTLGLNLSLIIYALIRRR
jgi:hypothetical protein